MRAAAGSDNNRAAVARPTQIELLIAVAIILETLAKLN